MSVASRRTGIGVAAVVFGLSLASPQATGIAVADSADAGASTASAGPAARHESKTGPVTRSTGTGKAGHGTARRAPKAVSDGSGRTPPRIGQTRSGTSNSVTVTVRPRGAATSVSHTEPPAASTRVAAVEPTASVTTTLTPTAQQIATTQAPSLTNVPPALRGLRALLGRVLAPIRTFFEGLALLTRRTLFNQVPTVNPIQTTGQTEGAITGDLHGSDADGDAIRYTVVQAPMHGSVVVNSDGTYNYTPGSDFTGLDSFIVAASDTGPHLNLLDLNRPAGAYRNVVITQGDASRATFTFSFVNGSQYWTPQAKAALEWSATQVSAYVVAGAAINIDLTVKATLARPKVVGIGPDGSPIYEKDCSTGYCSDTLASAGSPMVSGEGPGFRNLVAQQKLITGADPNGKVADGNVTVNFGNDWAFGDKVGEDEMDFESTMMHELLHALGFFDSVTDPNPEGRDVWTTYDRFITDANGTPVIDGSSYAFGAGFTPNLTGGNGGLFFGGPNSRAAYGGVVPLYDGSPSHLDDTLFDNTDPTAKNALQLMNSATDDGKGVRILSAYEIGVLKDLGFTIAVPVSQL